MAAPTNATGSKLVQAYAMLKRNSTQSYFANSENISMFDIKDGIRVFYLLDKDGSNSLSHDEIIEGCQTNKAVVELIEKYDGTALSMLKNKFEVASILKEIDADGNKTIDFHEWEDFLGMIIMSDIRFLKIKAFNTGRCYFGKGLDDGQVDGKYIKRGLLEDFWFYQSNNHFLLMICFRDPVHPLRTSSIINIEYVCQSFNLALVVFCAFIDGPPFSSFPPVYLTIPLATIPVICIRKFLLVSYKCPCCEDRKISHNDVKTCCARLAGHTIGFTFWCIGTVLTIVFIILAVGMGPAVGYGFLASWLQSYVYSVILDMMTQFNPLQISVAMRSWPWVGSLMKMMGMGAWLVERETIRNSEKYKQFERALSGLDMSGDGDIVARGAARLQMQAEQVHRASSKSHGLGKELLASDMDVDVEAPEPAQQVMQGRDGDCQGSDRDVQMVPMPVAQALTTATATDGVQTAPSGASGGEYTAILPAVPVPIPVPVPPAVPSHTARVAAPAPHTGWLKVKEGGLLSGHRKLFCVLKDGRFNCFASGAEESVDLGFDLQFGFDLKDASIKLISKSLELTIAGRSNPVDIQVNNKGDDLQDWEASAQHHIQFAAANI